MAQVSILTHAQCAQLKKCEGLDERGSPQGGNRGRVCVCETDFLSTCSGLWNGCLEVAIKSSWFKVVDRNVHSLPYSTHTDLNVHHNRFLINDLLSFSSSHIEFISTRHNFTAAEGEGGGLSPTSHLSRLLPPHTPPPFSTPPPHSHSRPLGCHRCLSSVFCLTYMYSETCK
jgi:hypothetical protein